MYIKDFPSYEHMAVKTLSLKTITFSQFYRPIHKHYRNKICINEKLVLLTHGICGKNDHQLSTNLLTSVN